MQTRIERIDRDRLLCEEAQRNLPPLSLLQGDVPLVRLRGMRFERLVPADADHRCGLWILLPSGR